MRDAGSPGYVRFSDNSHSSNKIVSFVRDIACFNVVSLLLARASARRREITTTLALGSGRGRLLQPFLAESLLLSLAGALLGVTLAKFVAVLLGRVPLPLPVPIVLDIRPYWPVAVYAALITVAAALMCGLLPAWQSVTTGLLLLRNPAIAGGHIGVPPIF